MEGIESNKVVVLGCNSFSGAHFVRLALSKGMQVVGISRSQEPDAVFLPYRWAGVSNRNRFNFFQMDLNHDLEKIISCINEFSPSYIVNFVAQGMVAQSWDHPDHWFQTNTLSMVCLIDRLKKCKFLKKFVQISTPEVYGSVTGNIKENTHYRPSTPYAISKAAADMTLAAYMKSYAFPVVFTRAANVFGPGQQLYRIIPKTVLCFLSGEKLQLHGGGVSRRSFIHISDVVEGTYQAMLKADPGEIFHFSTLQMISIKELVCAIAKTLGVSFHDNVEVTDEQIGKDASYSLDSSRAKKRLGWEPEIKLEQGVFETIEWIRLNREFLTKQPKEYIHKF